MKICMNHWTQLRQGIEDRGMGGLIGNAETLKERFEEEVEALQAGVEPPPPDPKKFDPLLSANNYVWSRGMQLLGLGAMYVDGTPGAPNDGHVCPLGYRAVSIKKLVKIASLIDPAPVVVDGKVMVFKNPMADKVLTRLSAEIRELLEDRAPDGVPVSDGSKEA